MIDMILLVLAGAAGFWVLRNIPGFLMPFLKSSGKTITDAIDDVVVLSPMKNGLLSLEEAEDIRSSLGLTDHNQLILLYLKTRPAGEQALIRKFVGGATENTLPDKEL